MAHATMPKYRELKQPNRDPRMNAYFLAAKPYQVITLLGIYLMFVFKFGPKWMKNKPPYKLRKILMIYNILQVLTCTLVFITGIKIAWGWKYRWVCEPVDFSNNNDAIQIARLVYFYFLLKVVDLADTIFFVLRKKINQVTFLHVYHHTGMVALSWGAATYYPGGHGTFIGIVNCFVHGVMYTYYFLAVAVPSVKQSSGWKKYITQLQILQFLMTIIHMSTIVFKPNCGYPRWTAALFLPQNIFMLILFVDFYTKTYINKRTAVIKPRVFDERSKVRGTVENVHKTNNNMFEMSMTNPKIMRGHETCHKEA